MFVLVVFECLDVEFLWLFFCDVFFWCGYEFCFSTSMTELLNSSYMFCKMYWLFWSVWMFNLLNLILSCFCVCLLLLFFCWIDVFVFSVKRATFETSLSFVVFLLLLLCCWVLFDVFVSFMWFILIVFIVNLCLIILFECFLWCWFFFFFLRVWGFYLFVFWRWLLKCV